MNPFIKAVLYSILFGVLVWLFDSLVDWIFFYDESLIELTFSSIPTHEIYIRTFFFSALIIFGLINGYQINKINRANHKLDAANQQLAANEQQLRASNQQLSASEQQLQAANQQLLANEKEISRKAYALGERLKELNCLFSIEEIVWSYNNSEEILQRTVNLIPGAWQYPDICCGRISLNSTEYKSRAFIESNWVQSAPIHVGSAIKGKIEVFYKEERPLLDEGPFLREERLLIDNIAKILSRSIEKIENDQQLEYERAQLKLHEKQFKALFEGIPDIMYVADPHNHQLVHVNNIAKQTYGENIVGRKCYEVIQNKKEPCSFCTNPMIFGENIGKTHIWEFKNESNNNWYRCSDKAIKWPDGRYLRFELATDITEQVKINEELLAANQQLMASEQQLKALNLQLKANEQQLVANEKQLIEFNKDLIQEKEVQQYLKKRIQLANNSAGIGVWDLDLINNILVWDDWMYKLYGVDKEKFGGAYENWKNGVHPDDAERANKEVEDAINGVKTFDTEFRIITPEGHIRYLKANGEVLRNEKGEAIKMIGVNYDITPLKNAYMELEVNEKRYLQAESMAKVASWEYNLETQQFWGSDEAKKIYGFTKADYVFTAEEVESCIPERARVHQALIDLIELEKPYNLEFEIKTKDKGESKLIKSIAILEKDPDGIPLKVTGAILDITQQKKIEQELLHSKKIAEENETRFKALHNASFGGITIHDKGWILDCNQGLSIITGYSIDELIGMDGLLLIAEESRDMVMDKILSRYEKAYEAIGIRKNGEKYPLRLEARMIPYKGKEVRVVEFRDITEQKQVEEELIVARRKAEESDKLKSAFLANMSHEIRTPMNGILGFTSLLEEPDLTGEEQAQYIEIIKRSGYRMLSTVNDIIDISKIDSGQMELVISEVDICLELDSIYQFFKLEAENKGLSLKIEKHHMDDHLKVKTDKNKIESIITNLIKNAIKYTDQGVIEITASFENGKLVFKVADSGIGIPQNRLEAIFNRFEQADIKDTRAKEGSGLGLAISKSYAEMMGGHLEVKSKLGKGSTFILSIPV
jgi:PAS domain S-box-containing protein